LLAKKQINRTPDIKIRGFLLELKMKVSDYIKANRRGSREAELENQTGWVGKHKIHKSDKIYTRKVKHKSSLKY